MMVAHAHSEPVFRSVRKPKRAFVHEDEVFLCDHCGHLSGREYQLILDLTEHECPLCDGYRILHGYEEGNYGLPAVLCGWREAETSTRENDVMPDRHAPLPPAA